MKQDDNSNRELVALPQKALDDYGRSQHEAGILVGSIVAVGMTSGRPLTFGGIVKDGAVGALVGFGAILGGRLFNRMFHRNEHAAVQDMPVHVDLPPDPNVKVTGIHMHQPVEQHKS